MPPLVDITHVAVIGDRRLRLSCENGTVGEVAFDEREWRMARRLPAVGRSDIFAQVRLRMGTIAWPNGLDMAPEPLFEEASRHPAAQPGPRRETDSPQGAARGVFG